ncbi:MAG: SDR family NAD(P)-dependent oxidoreductase [Edaphobacter sp.]
MTALQNKTALVTGASRGIGRATALALAAAGAHVLVHYGRSAEEAKAVVSEIEGKGGRANATARTWELLTARRCSLNRCAPSWETVWMWRC